MDAWIHDFDGCPLLIFWYSTSIVNLNDEMPYDTVKHVGLMSRYARSEAP